MHHHYTDYTSLSEHDLNDRISELETSVQTILYNQERIFQIMDNLFQLERRVFIQQEQQMELIKAHLENPLTRTSKPVKKMFKSLRKKTSTFMLDAKIFYLIKKEKFVEKQSSVSFVGLNSNSFSFRTCLTRSVYFVLVVSWFFRRRFEGTREVFSQ